MRFFSWLQRIIDRLFGRPVEGDREEMLKEWDDLKRRAKEWEKE